MADPVLVTGSTGFIGQALEKTVRDRGVPCLGVARRIPVADEDHRAVDLLGDTTGLQELLLKRRPSVIFHLAGGAESGDFFAANVTTTKNLLRVVACLSDYNPRVIVLGSAAEYGDLGPEPIGETARERPVNEYGVAKLAQTRLALVERRRGRRLTVVRLFNVVGPGMSIGLAASRFAREAIAAIATKRTYITVGDLTAVRDFLDIGDVTRGLWAIAHAPEEEIVNLCSGEPIRIQQILDEILRQIGARFEVRVDGNLIRGPAEIPVCIGDPSRLERLTGLRFRFRISDSIKGLLERLQ